MKNLIKNINKKEFYPFWVFFSLLLSVFILYAIFLSALFLYLWFFLFLIFLFFVLKLILVAPSHESLSVFKSSDFISFLNTLETPIIIYNKDFKIILINKKTESLLKIKKSEVEGIIIGPESIKDAKLSLITKVLFPSMAPGAKQVSGPGKWPIITTLSFDNPELELKTTINRLKDSEKGVFYFIKTIEDKTHEKSILKAKDDFIDVAAHQLRTPLTAIHWSLEGLVDMSNNSPEIKRAATDILELSERTLKITNDLLDASKIEDGRFGYNFQKTNIYELVGEIIKETKEIAKRRSITITNSPIDKNLPVFIDKNSISMVLFNLIDNAIRYNTKNGKVFISIKEIDNGRFVKIIVEDTGVGIPKEDISNIFKKLHRGSNVVQIEPNGSGLGLYVAKNIVARHGGKIGVESVINRGSVFWFTIPTKEENKS